MTRKHVKDDNFLVLQAWMLDCGFTRVELNVYAVIYGLSQGGEESYARCSRAYLAEWGMCTLQGLDKALKSLVAKGYLKKRVRIVNKVKYCDYKAIRKPVNSELSTPAEKEPDLTSDSVGGGYPTQLVGVPNSVGGGTQLSCHQYIKEYIENNKVCKKEGEPSQEIDRKSQEVDKKSQEVSRESYEDIIDKRGFAPEVKEVIFEYIKMRMIKKRPMTNYALKYFLTNLIKLSKDPEEQIEMLNNAIAGCYNSVRPLVNKPKALDANKFHNFEERKNDYDELERRLLGY
jgi:hypothetical protein